MKIKRTSTVSFTTAFAVFSLALTGCSDSSSNRTSSGSAAIGAAAARASTVEVPTHPGWEDVLIDPTGEFVYPTAVTAEGTSTQTNDADALKQADGKCATLTTSTPLLALNNSRLVIDLGINTGGLIEIGLCDGTTASVHLAYAERREWLNNDGDYSGDNISQDDDELEARSYDIPAGQRGKVAVPGIQGAQRWISLSLGSAGVAKVDYVRVKPTHLRVSSPTAKGFGYTGRFFSSDPLLNTIWAQSAYTTSLVALKDPQRDRFVYVDGAKRDRMVWLGDVGNQGLAAYYSHKDGRKIMKDTLAMFACQQYPSGYLPMFSQIFVACKDDYSDLEPDGPVPHKLEPLEEFGRLGEYTAWWVIGVGDYYIHSGDRAFAKAMLPVARRTVDYFESRSNNGLYCTGQIGSDTPPPALISALNPLGQQIANLLDVFSLIGKATSACIPAYPFEINWQPFDLAGGESMHTNAVIYRAYKKLAYLEREVGLGEAAAARLDDLAETRRKAMMRSLWDESAGAFKVNTLNPQVNHTQDGNVEALLAGVVTSDQAERVLDFMDNKLQGTYGTLTGELDNDPFMQKLFAPFIGSRELVARLDRYDTTGALNLLRRLWGHMTRSDPASTLWERVGLNGDIPAYNIRVDFTGKPSLIRPAEGFTSAAHGWGAGPLNAMTGYLVGIRPVRPGFSTWLVEPQPGDLDWAEGQVDTPAGLLSARWSRETTGFHLTVTAPVGTQGTVAIPLLGSGRNIYRNGKPVWQGGVAVAKVNAVRRGDYVHFAGIENNATFAW